MAGVQNSQEITYENNLVGTEAETIGFLRTMAGLGDRLVPFSFSFRRPSPSRG